MNVAIVGLGYVGAVTAACLARLGQSVIGVDTDPHKVEAIAAGRSPIDEPGLDELLAEAVASGRLTTGTIAEAVAALGRDHDRGRDAQRTIRRSRPGRPEPRHRGDRRRAGDGRTLPHRRRAQHGPPGNHRRGGASTARVEVGHAGRDRLRPRDESGVPPRVASIRDFFEASRTVIGADDERSAQAVRDVYDGLPAPVFVVPIRTSEMIKYTDNAFHAAKIAFANEIASFARANGVDGREVMRVMRADDRLNISTAYLRPGYAFGGSCLPKDLRAITDRARKTDVDLPLLDAALSSNAAHFERGVRLVEESGLRNVGLLGLSFKSATDDLRESPAVGLAERLLGKGYRLSIYDEDIHPDRLRGANRAFIDEHLPHLRDLLSESLDATLAASDVIVLTKIWPDVENLAARLRDDQVLVDLVGLPAGSDRLTDRYAGIGW